MLEENDVKKELKDSAEVYKNRLEEDLSNSINEIQKWVNTGLWVGGSILVGFTLYKLISPGKESMESTKEEPNGEFGIVKSVLHAGSEMLFLFLLSYAKKRLRNYISDLNTMKSSEREARKSEK